VTAALDIDHVSHSFGAFRPCQRCVAVVPRGGFTALLGVNGAGKTTLFSLITRLYDNTSGTDQRRGP
jgi:ABC-2 type transport system ATP-binding protein